MNTFKFFFEISKKKSNKRGGLGIKAIFMLLFVVVLTGILGADRVEAKVLDEILDYKIIADVLEDATVNLTYDVTWKVLDSDSEGPLEWVQIGLPNSDCNSLVANSANITSISNKNSGGNYAVIYFDRKYYEGEVIEFSFSANHGYLYQYYPEEGVCEYTFTPGWFDTTAIDNLEIRWNADKALKIEPASFNEDGYYFWQVALGPGEKYSVEIQYPQDAFAFDLTQHKTEDDGYKFSEHPLWENIIVGTLSVIIMLFGLALCIMPIVIPIIIVNVIYRAMTGFTSTKTKKVTRTIVEYYESCPNCGGTREEGKEKCSYCGTNMVKSKEEITEEEAKKTDESILNFKEDGEFRYSSNPNRYVRVHTVVVPHVVRSTTSSSSSGRSHHSSCAHSSCACACACACAGGGRAGCSTKDFYKTNFKLSYLK